MLALVLACVATSAPFAPRLVAFMLALAALRAMRLYPRKTIDIGWADLLAAFRFVLFPSSKTRASVEATIGRLTSDHAIPCLSARTGADLIFASLNLPKGSEVLVVPGITIPSMLEIMRSHGLRPVGVDLPSHGRLLISDLKPFITAETRVLVLTHLFGTVYDAGSLIREAKELGIFVIEDCAQAFLGASAKPKVGDRWKKGFCGHDEANAVLLSFGLMKTMTALGGAVCLVRDQVLRNAVQEMQAAYPTRPTSQFLKVTLKALLIKMVGNPFLWGIFAALVSAFGCDFDEVIIGNFRGFPNSESIRQRPSLPLLRLLARRLRNQNVASFSAANSTVAKRQEVASVVIQRLSEAGVPVASSDDETTSWWLVPVLDEAPSKLARGLSSRGFDASCSSTQLKGMAAAQSEDQSSSQLVSSESLMQKVVYLPITPEMPHRAARALAEAVIDVQQRSHTARSAPGQALDFTPGPVARLRLGVFVFACLLAAKPKVVLGFLPSAYFVIGTLMMGIIVAFFFILVAKRLAAEPKLQVKGELLHALAPRARAEGVAFWNAQPSFEGRIHGAVLLTGSTGFVGTNILFALLSKSQELDVTRIVLMIRRKGRSGGPERLSELRKNPVFQEVQDAFNRLVVVIEGNMAERGFGWSDSQQKWPYSEPLRAVVHCAGDVRFDQPLQQAAISLASGTLQMAEQAVRWEARRFIFVSTAFVHAAPSSTNFLPEGLVELRDFDPMELYLDAVKHGKWAAKAMRELGFPNTYTFSKAITEHLVSRLCSAERLDVRIVRPSIVGPAWAAPHAGWNGSGPSTVTAGAALIAGRGLRVFRSSAHPCPIVPVDLVADSVLRATAGAVSTSGGQVLHATLDASEADQMPSFSGLTVVLLQLLALEGDMSLPEAGLICHFLRWANNIKQFWLLHFFVNVLPCRIAVVAMATICWAAKMVGLCSDSLKQKYKTACALNKHSSLPVLYLPFSSPTFPWLFCSGQRLPSDWNSMEYSVMTMRAAIGFVRSTRGSVPPRNSPRSQLQLHVLAPRSAWYDAFLMFSMPESSLGLSAAAFMIRRVLQWMDLAVTLDAASLVAVINLETPIALCPTHRSLLDFVIVGLACFQLKPLLPKLQVPHVAADAEFSRLPLLGPILRELGAFFLRRGGGAVQPDPALRVEVDRAMRSGKPIEVFLEGLRSRGRRHMRLRTGLLRTLRDVSQRTVALVPLSISYELLPEDQSFFDELQGLPRPPLRTASLIHWVLRGLRGELPFYGNVHMQLGPANILDGSANLPEILSSVQEKLVDLTSLSTLHGRALAELLELPTPLVCTALTDAGISMRTSRFSDGVRLTDAQRWPLALQTAAMLKDRLPRHWAHWLVEPVAEGYGGQPGELSEAAISEAVDRDDVAKDYESSVLDVDAVVAALSEQLEEAVAAGRGAAERLHESGMLKITEEHLVQQLLQTQDGRRPLPPPLARGAAAIVARQLLPRTGKLDSDAVGPAKVRETSKVESLWPDAVNSLAPMQQRNEEALDRWGFKDTRFVARWVDGQPAVQMASKRYGSVGERPSFQLWAFFQRELKVSMGVRDTLPEKPLPDLPPPADGLVAQLSEVLPNARIRSDVEARLRGGTGHALADIWRLRIRETLRMPDAVVRPETEDEVLAVLRAAESGSVRFAVVPVGGRTNVTSATACPEKTVDSRPFVAMDMRGLSKVLSVNKEDGLAHVQAGITGSALKEALRKQGVTMGMEPDSMELSTLGGWIATRASGMKRAKYGNIEDMLLEVRLATTGGIVWQSHGSKGSVGAAAFSRTSSGMDLRGLVLGSEGCLGIVTSAVVRVRPLPEAVEHQSVIFPNWDLGAKFMREVARLPAAIRPTSCRLMDNRQLKLAQALREDDSRGQLRTLAKQAFLRMNGVSLEGASAVTLLFEGSRQEVVLQKRALGPLVRSTRGLWGGASSGEAGYALTFAIAYIRDFGLDYRILSESLETLAPWSVVASVWPAVQAAVIEEHRALRIPGRPFLSVRMTQLYDEGAVLYMYMAISTAGLTCQRALQVFQRLEHTARRAILDAGGCLSHHHGVGKIRAELLPSGLEPLVADAARGVKAVLDPRNVLGAGNGAWWTPPSSLTPQSQPHQERLSGA